MTAAVRSRRRVPPLPSSFSPGFQGRSRIAGGSVPGSTGRTGATSVTVQGAPGLRMHWGVYRGPAENVRFDPIQLKTWMDSRVYSNSPWSPPFVLPEVPEDKTWTVRATFDEPGEYTLLAVASDGSMTTYDYIDVMVTP